MQRVLAAALLGSTLLASVAAHAEGQCEPVLPSAEPSQARPAPPPPAPAADALRAAGMREMPPDEVRAIPGLNSVVAAGALIFVIGNSGDTPNLLAVNGSSFQAFTPLPNRNYLCRGVIQDAEGNNVTLAEVRAVPGFVPPAGQPELASINTPDEALAAMSKASYGSAGPETAPVVWAVIDPLCHFSQDAIRRLLPYAKLGQIRLNVVPVSVLSQQSVPAARALLTEAPGHMVDRWFRPDLLSSPLDAGSESKLKANNRLFAGMSVGSMKVTGVPELIWVSGGQAHAKAGLDQAEVASFIAGLKS